METFLQKIYDTSSKLLPLVGIATLIVLIILMIKLMETLRKVNDTVDSLNETIDEVNDCIDELKPAFHTVRSVAYSIETLRATLEEFIANGIDKAVTSVEKVKNFIISIIKKVKGEADIVNVDEDESDGQ